MHCPSSITHSPRPARSALLYTTMLFATAICALMTALSASATPLLNPRQNTAASPAGVLYSPLNGTTTFDGGKVNFTYVPEKSDTIYVNVAVVQFITVGELGWNNIDKKDLTMFMSVRSLREFR